MNNNNNNNNNDQLLKLKTCTQGGSAEGIRMAPQYLCPFLSPCTSEFVKSCYGARRVGRLFIPSIDDVAPLRVQTLVQFYNVDIYNDYTYSYIGYIGVY